MFMPAATLTADLPSQPDQADKPSRVGHLLTLLRRLIDYGKELATTHQRPGTSTDPSSHTHAFGTSNTAYIIARITRGLLLARALEDRLVSAPAHLDAPPRPRCTPAARTPRVAAPLAPPPAKTDPMIVRLPTSKQIAAAVRRRPVGAVIADICRDLGILPSHPLWRELTQAISNYGGRVGRLMTDVLDRLLPMPPTTRQPRVQPELPPTPVSTGPP
jgi:hypothetical protein